MSEHLSTYGKNLRDASVPIYYDSDDGVTEAELVLEGCELSGEPLLRVWVSTRERKYGGATVVKDAGPLAHELCARHRGLALAPEAAGQRWSFVVSIPGLTPRRRRGLRIWRRVVLLAQGGAILGFVALFALVTGILSGVARWLRPACSGHEPCAPGFCDRGRCMAVGEEPGSLFGAACRDATSCGELVCVRGRCGSCEKDEECVSQRGENLYCNRASLRHTCRNEDADRYVGP